LAHFAGGTDGAQEFDMRIDTAPDRRRPIFPDPSTGPPGTVSRKHCVRRGARSAVQRCRRDHRRSLEFRRRARPQLMHHGRRTFFIERTTLCFQSAAPLHHATDHATMSWRAHDGFGCCRRPKHHEAISARRPDSVRRAFLHHNTGIVQSGCSSSCSACATYRR